MPLTVSIDEPGVGEIQLSWPERSNALGPREAAELRLGIEGCVEGGARVVVVSAAGRAFCAGGDLVAIRELVAHGESAVREEVYGSFQGLFRTITACPVPVFAAVDGPAVGLGCDLALACTVTYVGTHGWLRQGWARLGLIPASGGVEYVRCRGGALAVWQFLTTDRLSGPAAEKLGLAVSVPDARAAALRAAGALAQLPDGVVAATQDLLGRHELEDHLAAALDHQVAFLTSPRFAELADRALGRGSRASS